MARPSGQGHSIVGERGHLYDACKRLGLPAVFAREMAGDVYGRSIDDLSCAQIRELRALFPPVPRSKPDIHGRAWGTR